MDTISRKAAIERGLPFYFTGKPCKHGHITKRRVPHGTCVECERLHQVTEQQREYHRQLKRTPKYKQMAKEYRERLYGTNQYKEQVRISHIKRTYGLSREEYYALLEAQNNKCCICGSPFTEEVVPCVDHCHNTQRVRGVLCNSCNNLLGFAKDDVHILERAIVYLRK